MNITLTAEKAPLVIGEDGVVRVEGSRVTLDTVVGAFNSGASAEEIAEQYPTVSLADVYAIISYYLHRQDEVHAYLSERRQFAEGVRRENEKRSDMRGVRQRLLTRRNADCD